MDAGLSRSLPTFEQAQNGFGTVLVILIVGQSAAFHRVALEMFVDFERDDDVSVEDFGFGVGVVNPDSSADPLFWNSRMSRIIG
jgi:hypothetical protein